VIAALLIGRAGSTGFPNKNIAPLLGRPLMVYPILAAQHARSIAQGAVYLSTDSEKMREIAATHGCHLVDRPEWLATDEALAEDAFRHGFRVIRASAPEPIEFIVLLFCNAATITPGIIDVGVEALRQDPSLDSAVTVSQYDMWSPLRAKKIENGLLTPFVPLEFWDDVSCDRHSQGATYFADCSVFVCRPRCLDPSYGDLPFRWMGRRVYPLPQWGGLDVDYEWQLGQVEFWLRRHGFSETRTPYDA
jgi:CMP-N-acetylneuraminic acid synthetase